MPTVTDPDDDIQICDVDDGGTDTPVIGAAMSTIPWLNAHPAATETLNPPGDVMPRPSMMPTPGARVSSSICANPRLDFAR